jgi:peptidoglycan-associated lipoprotein
MRPLSTLAVLVSSAVLLAACSSVKLDEKKPPVEEKAAAPVKDTTRTVQEVKTESVDPLNDPKGELAKRSVYFDYDSYVVKDEFKPLIAAHGKYLSLHKERKIIIQGNTDERGGSEYNLALGQKRAEAVRKSLALVGVPDAQMEAVSLGKEKPKALGHDEASWTENRRADIVYQ